MKNWRYCFASNIIIIYLKVQLNWVGKQADLFLLLKLQLYLSSFLKPTTLEFFVNTSFSRQIAKEDSRQNAAWNQRNQGFPPEGQAKGCQECQDQEELRVHQIQGSMLPIPLHPRHQRQGEGREAEAISASRSSS